jgi:hypothetical protein
MVWERHNNLEASGIGPRSFYSIFFILKCFYFETPNGLKKEKKKEENVHATTGRRVRVHRSAHVRVLQRRQQVPDLHARGAYEHDGACHGTHARGRTHATRVCGRDAHDIGASCGVRRLIFTLPFLSPSYFPFFWGYGKLPGLSQSWAPPKNLRLDRKIKTHFFYECFPETFPRLHGQRRHCQPYVF